MRKHRTIYFNDARHYYLFVFEPPMRLKDAWVPIDEVAGTAVDTFSYGVSRGDGLFGCCALGTAALGSFRGLIVDVLWYRAYRLKEDGKFYEANKLSQAITQLQPRFPQVWVFHAWNIHAHA